MSFFQKPTLIRGELRGCAPIDIGQKCRLNYLSILVQPFNEVVQLALHGHADAMNPFE